MKFLEEKFWREKQNSFLKANSKLMSGKWRTKLVYKKLQVKDQRVRFGHKKRSQEKASVKCQEEGTVRSKYRALRFCVDQVTIECIGKSSWWTQGDRSWRMNKLSTLQGRKAKQGKELKNDLKSTRLELQSISGQNPSNTFLPLY